MGIIEQRVSTRIFDERSIHDDILIQLAKAGCMAPSSKTKEPWQFVIINDRQLLSTLATKHSNWKILEPATAAIIVCGDFNKDGREAQTLLACAAATQNILLKAIELEIGSVWLGAYPDQARIDWLREALELPQEILPISVVALGYGEIRERNRTVNEDAIHFNQFGK